MNQADYIKKVNRYFRDGTDAFLPHVSINCIVFSFTQGELNVLVQRLFDNEIWFLPGGYIYKGEDLDKAASRNLEHFGLKELLHKDLRVSRKSVVSGNVPR